MGFFVCFPQLDCMRSTLFQRGLMGQRGSAAATLLCTTWGLLAVMLQSSRDQVMYQLHLELDLTSRGSPSAPVHLLIDWRKRSHKAFSAAVVGDTGRAWPHPQPAGLSTSAKYEREPCSGFVESLGKKNSCSNRYFPWTLSPNGLWMKRKMEMHAPQTSSVNGVAQHLKPTRMWTGEAQKLEVQHLR